MMTVLSFLAALAQDMLLAAIPAAGLLWYLTCRNGH